MTNFQARMIRRLPPGIRAFPLDAMLAAMAIPAGLANALGLASSRAMDELLVTTAQGLWAVCLIVGAGAWLAGVLGVTTQEGVLVLRRLPLLIFGLYLLSLASMVYAVAVLVLNGWAGVLAAWPLLTFAAGLHIRRVDLAETYRRRPR